MQWREPARIEVGREQAAAIGHQRGERQRLAAGSGAEVDHRLAGLCSCQQGDELRALVLDLEAAGEEGRFGLERWPSPVHAGLEAQRIGRPGAGLRGGMGKLARQSLARRLQPVGADVDLAFRDSLGPEGAGKAGPEPFGHVGTHPVRRARQRQGHQPVDLIALERRGRVVLAGAERGDLLQIQPALAREHAEHQSARRVRPHHMRAGGLPAQRVIDQRGDRGAILRAGEAARQAPVLERVGRRPAPLDDVVQNLDGGADAGGGRHGVSDSGNRGGEAPAQGETGPIPS